MGVELQALIAAQAGVLSVEQARLAGLRQAALRRLSANWLRLSSGLYCISEPTWMSAAWAGVLRGGGHAVLGGLASAYVLGVLDRAPETLTVFVPLGCARADFDVHTWRVRFRRAERNGRGLLPITPVEQTLVDIASEADETQTIAAVVSVLRQGKTTRSRLLNYLESQGRVAKRQLMVALCDESARGIESVLEWRYRELVERAHGLPPMQRQARLTSTTRSDGWYADYRVVIELDGRTWHDLDRDMRRDNVLAVAGGVVTLRFGWQAVNSEPCESAAQVARLLSARGWDGLPRPCPRCRNQFANFL